MARALALWHEFSSAMFKKFQLDFQAIALDSKEPVFCKTWLGEVRTEEVLCPEENAAQNLKTRIDEADETLVRGRIRKDSNGTQR